MSSGVVLIGVSSGAIKWFEFATKFGATVVDFADSYMYSAEQHVAFPYELGLAIVQYQCVMRILHAPTRALGIVTRNLIEHDIRYQCTGLVGLARFVTQPL